MQFFPSQRVMFLACLLFFSIVALCNGSTVESQQQQQQQQLRAPVVPSSRQEDDQRQLGDVIIVSSSYNDNDYNHQDEDIIPEAAEEEVEILSFGPSESDVPIDVGTTAVAASTNEVVYTDRVVGGKGSNPKSYYAMLLYQDSAGWKFAGCGATLISNCHVITAAHCVEDRTFEISGIYVNAHSPYQGNSGNPFFFTTAKSIEVPTNYDDYTNVNDIAIIRMSQCVDPQQYAPAVPASSTMYNDGDLLDLYGFGRLGENSGRSGDTKELQVATLPYISSDSCKKYFGSKIKYGMFCAGYPETGGVDACQGDSGSGLLDSPASYSNDPAVLVGIVSWGVGCARKGYPGVYAKIEDYYDWIKTNVCSDPDLDDSITWCTSTTTTTNNGGTEALTLRNRQCVSSDRCGQCEGECHADQHCAGSMICFKRSWSNPFSLIPGCKGTGVATRNYCYDPNLSRYAYISEEERKKARQEATETQLTEQATRTTNSNNIRGGGARRKQRQRQGDIDDYMKTTTKRRWKSRPGNW